MNRHSLRRFWMSLRRTSPLDRVAFAFIGLYVVVRLAAWLRVFVPFSSFLGVVSFAAIVYLLVRALPWFRTQLLWRLRNRLIVAYLFIAVVPIVLLLTMMGAASYLLYMQLGAHLLHDDLQEQITVISAEADAISGAIDREVIQRGGQDVSKGASPAGESVLSRPGVAGVISAAQSEWPGLRVSLNRGQRLLKSGGGDRFAGLVESEGKLWLASVKRGTGRGAPVYVFVGMPLTSSFLDTLPSELGPIQLILLEPSAQRPANGLSLEIDGRQYVTGEQVASTRRALAPPVHWFDVRVTGASTLEAYPVEMAKVASSDPVLASFSLRPSTLSGRLFTSVGAVGPIFVDILLVAAIIFLLLEITALATGIVLTRTITRSVADLYEATRHVRRGDFSYRVRVPKRDQLGVLGESFNEMTSSVSELIDEQRERQRLENEVSIAREVQQQLFPSSLPSLQGLELAAICRPARVVSGDYYDFIRLGPTRVGIALADISGKGIFAALLMASLQAALRSTAVLGGQGDTAELVSRLNRHLFKNTSDDRYATLFYAVYDSEAKTLTYTNAGHLAPFLVVNGRIEQLDVGGTVVGLFEDPPYKQGTLKITSGTLLVAFSDGLTEPENVYGEEFGIERLKGEVLRHQDIKPQRLAENAIGAVEQWAGTPEQADDITIVVARMG